MEHVRQLRELDGAISVVVAQDGRAVAFIDADHEEGSDATTWTINQSGDTSLLGVGLVLMASASTCLEASANFSEADSIELLEFVVGLLERRENNPPPPYSGDVPF